MTLNISKLTEIWQQVDSLAHAAVAPIENEGQLWQATSYREAILDEIGEIPGHPLDSLARSLIERITAYEAIHYPIPDADGPDMLAFMLEQRSLTQKALAEMTGIPQSTISDLMNRKRDFTADHARKLGAFFKLHYTFGTDFPGSLIPTVFKDGEMTARDSLDVMRGRG